MENSELFIELTNKIVSLNKRLKVLDESESISIKLSLGIILTDDTEGYDEVIAMIKGINRTALDKAKQELKAIL